MSEAPLPLATRIWFAWLCFFRVLSDGAFASRVWDARQALPPSKPAEPASSDAALQLLALFQREGRLIDFLQQEIAPFTDAEIGATARVVHEGCRKALHTHVKLTPVRSEEEGAPLTLAAGFDPAQVKLSGNVAGGAPYKGILRHRGWRATELTLPSAVKGHDPTVIAAAEVEL